MDFHCKKSGFSEISNYDSYIDTFMSFELHVLLKKTIIV